MGMMTMGTISIFSLDFSGIKFTAAREFTGGYTLRAGEHVLPMTPAVADALAQGGRSIRWRAQAAARSGREMKPGATFRRDLQAVDGNRVHVEIGVADSGDGIFLEIGTTRLALADGQAQMLLFVLDQLGRDVTSVSRASETLVPDFGVAAGLRGFRYPWEGDPTW
jgi:hypothetical protein